MLDREGSTVNCGEVGAVVTCQSSGMYAGVSGKTLKPPSGILVSPSLSKDAMPKIEFNEVIVEGFERKVWKYLSK